jgi:hypothetical protein
MMDKIEITWRGDLRRVKPKPGDVFICTLPQAVDAETAEFIRSQTSLMLRGAPVVVMANGMRLDVASPPP